MHPIHRGKDPNYPSQDKPPGSPLDLPIPYWPTDPRFQGSYSTFIPDKKGARRV
jgi:hypothetical protein